MFLSSYRDLVLFFFQGHKAQCSFLVDHTQLIVHHCKGQDREEILLFLMAWVMKLNACEILWGRESPPLNLQSHALLKVGPAQVPWAWFCGQTSQTTPYTALGDSLSQKFQVSSSTAALVTRNKSFPCLTQQKGFQDCWVLPAQELWACPCAAGLALHPHSDAQLPSAGHGHATSQLLCLFVPNPAPL